MTTTKRRTLPAKYEPGFMQEMDGRTTVAQRLSAAYDAIVADVGGNDGLAHTRRAMIERFVFLEAMLQTLEAQIVEGGDNVAELVGRWVQGINAMTGLARMIGLERKTRTVDLRAYVRERQA